MSKKIPTFLTGANAKIKVNGRTIALATSVSYNIDVNHASPRVLGRYEVEEHQPLTYDVSGSFSIIRYVGGPGHDALKDTNNEGNGIGYWGTTSRNKGEQLLTNGSVNGSFDPSKMHRPIGFEIEIYQKTTDGSYAVARFRGVRISSTSFNMQKKSAAAQSFEFKAQYADEDSFGAAISGVGQQFA